MGFDLYPYTENQIAAVKRSIVQWEFIDELARQLDRDALDAADSRADAVAAYTEVYRVLGPDDTFVHTRLAARR